MDTLNDILIILAGLFPLFSGIALAVMLIISLKNYSTQLELQAQQTLLWFVVIVSLKWFTTSIYVSQLELFSSAAPFVMLLSLYASVFYYRFIYIITNAGTKTFWKWHFIFPIIIFCAEILRNLFLPNYPFSDQLIGLLYAVIYLSFSILLLFKYSKKNIDEINVKKYRWITLLILPSLTSTIIQLLYLFLPSGKEFTAKLIIILMVIFVLTNALVVYKVLSRKFLSYIVFPNNRKYDEAFPINENKAPIIVNKRRVSEFTTDENGRQIIVKLTKERFEEFIETNKPYLDPQLKITDLIKPLKANRTFISNFINKTYRLNFNQYINTLRLKELERISNLPANVGKKPCDLIHKVGFASMRNYIRALNIGNNKNEK